MADEKQLTMGEIRKTIATALAAAFGFTIALVWSNFVTAGIAMAGVKLSPAEGGGVIDLLIFAILAIVITVVMVVLIVVVGRWGLGRKA